ncbi:SymE family type I addiction module toxin [Hufsiella ginkgonis]|uniref:Type I addiction module toxin, SymE family n=1 Tax=Hufsiella ginkgonis TaxID=2695274 RepID=A0A7K1XSR5_9SPHI|nr:SymE family type I addiction module toxin [Hufsiella ginkgonis]MXV13909.1 type I addiction module toxin, SymE family [Hufsiella ginkgonis]MXV13917.1 type I addiction module toxin, SymE family [Hufsiella ginkgonis]
MKPELTTRTIRVYKKYGATNQQRPHVTMTGLWLEQADFKPGDYVNIEVEEGKLTLSRTKWVPEQPAKKSRKK